VSKDTGRGADEVGTAGIVSEKRDDDDGGVGEGDLAGDGRPAGEGRALQTEEEENAAEEALDAAPLAEWICQNAEYTLLILYGSFQARGQPRLDLDGHAALLAASILLCGAVF